MGRVPWVEDRVANTNLFSVVANNTVIRRRDKEKKEQAKTENPEYPHRIYIKHLAVSLFATTKRQSMQRKLFVPCPPKPNPPPLVACWHKSGAPTAHWVSTSERDRFGSDFARQTPVD